MNILVRYKVQIWFEDEGRRENVNGKSNTLCRRQAERAQCMRKIEYNVPLAR